MVAPAFRRAFTTAGGPYLEANIIGVLLDPSFSSMLPPNYIGWSTFSRERTATSDARNFDTTQVGIS